MNETLMEIKIGEDKRILPHKQECTEFFYMIHGNLSFTIESNTFDVLKGDFFIIPAGQQQSCRASKKVLYLIIRLNHSIAKMYINPDLICCDVQKSRQECSDNEKVRRLLRKIMNLYLSEDTADALLLQASYYELLYHLFYFYKDSKAMPDSQEQLRKYNIQKFIEENYFYPVKLADLAKSMHFSTVYMSRHFKKIFGINFLDYLNQFRLKRAQEMLLNNMNRSVAQIAMDCGFPNLTSFYKSFNELVGTSPAKYRSEMKYITHQHSSTLENAKSSLRNYLKLGINNDTDDPGYEQILCSAAIEAVKYDKCWNTVINMGDISSMARSDFQKHALFLKQELGFSHVRLWNIHAPDLQIIKYHNEQLTFDFSRLDRIFDFFVENGLHLYLDLGNKPARILRGSNDIISEERYPILLSNTSDYKQFIEHFIEHLCRRYGKDEISEWYFECWFDYENTAKNATILYETRFCLIYDAVKRYAPMAKVGGIGDMSEPLYHMKEVLKRQDFVSIYSYPNDYPKDTPAALSALTNQILFRDDFLEYQCSQLKDIVNPSKNIEKHISEWGFSISNRNLLNDSIYKAAYIVKNCIKVIGQIDLLAYWMGTDLFAEYNDTKNILFGGTGLLSRHMFLKPSYYAFNFLNHMGGYLLTRTDNAIITTNGDNDYWILCHNHKKLENSYFQLPEEKITAENYMDYLENMDKYRLNICITDLDNGEYHVKIRIINEYHGNLIGLWKEMGQPNELTLNDVKYLQQRCIPLLHTHISSVINHSLHLDFEMEPNEIRLIHIYIAK